MPGSDFQLSVCAWAVRAVALACFCAPAAVADETSDRIDALLRRQAEIEAELAPKVARIDELDIAFNDLTARYDLNDAGWSQYDSDGAAYDGELAVYDQKLASYNAGVGEYNGYCNGTFEEPEYSIRVARCGQWSAELDAQSAQIEADYAWLESWRTSLESTRMQLESDRAALDAEYDALYAEDAAIKAEGVALLDEADANDRELLLLSQGLEAPMDCAGKDTMEDIAACARFGFDTPVYSEKKPIVAPEYEPLPPAGPAPMRAE